MNKKEPLEHDEQVEYAQWLKRNKIPFFAIPNGHHRRITTATRLKLEGVMRGVPDLFISRASGGYYGLFIEMKRQTQGNTSEHQDKWIQLLIEEGYRVEVARGAKHAKQLTKEYLNG